MDVVLKCHITVMYGDKALRHLRYIYGGGDVFHNYNNQSSPDSDG